MIQAGFEEPHSGLKLGWGWVGDGLGLGWDEVWLGLSWGLV